MPPVAEKLRAKVVVDLAGCWIWQGATDPAGYGALKIVGKKRNAHRVSYETFVGPVPRGRILCRRRHDAACINPDHLYAWTRAQSIADAKQAGRNIHPRLTAGQATAISRSRLAPERLAKRYGVNFATIVKVRRGDTHKPQEARLMGPPGRKRGPCGGLAAVSSGREITADTTAPARPGQDLDDLDHRLPLHRSPVVGAPRRATPSWYHCVADRWSEPRP